MIGSLIDELNKSADEWNGSNMFELARMCRNAADTIWQLRDDLQQTNAENAKLREQIHWLKQGDILHVLTDQEYIDQCERERLMQVSIDALDKENAKLRELCEDMLSCIEIQIAFDRTPKKRMYKEFAGRARELGIEVDE
jgi:hypothetical protein